MHSAAPTVSTPPWSGLRGSAETSGVTGDGDTISDEALSAFNVEAVSCEEAKLKGRYVILAMTCIGAKMM